MDISTNKRYTGELDVKCAQGIVHWTGHDSDSIIEWCLSATRHAPKSVYIPFFPYGRADRIIAVPDGFYEPNGCLMMCRLLRTFAPNATIKTLDAHNPRVLEMFGIENCWPTRLWHAAFDAEEPQFLSTVAIAPDYGANERCKAFAACHGVPMITCSKSRTLDNSKVEVSVPNPEQIRGKNCLVIDDILDGGRTFIDLAAKLKQAGAARVVLIITHGIFSNGFDLGSDIDKIYTMSDTLANRLPEISNIKVYNYLF